MARRETVLAGAALAKRERSVLAVAEHGLEGA
ncbi:hypothetical protein J2X61_004153 [Bacillus sp. 3255]|nr:hypothetical protein [Bacillus sp. 3255]